jgi:Fe-S cluster assembly protein SufD
MMTRGISRRDAVRILVEGYFEEVIQRLHDPRLEELVRERIAEKIAAAEDDVREYVEHR